MESQVAGRRSQGKAGARSPSGYKDLLVWQKAMDLVQEIYLATGLFPKAEIYGLTNQIRRAAVSIPSNMAEGYGRSSKNEFNRFLQISAGSLAELETQLMIALRLRFLPESKMATLHPALLEIGRMISGLKKSLQTHPSS